ncbi:bifunctional serine/threonine-protein kinase/glutamate ABC transporter substrate-binding protein [Streptomyces sp. NBC_01669]|uniref:bifunctional serine/threonine-protein kinase/glutamate ABC transporter substrate-binding protein n=1 Tax=Streptomyces sp. NBC_01669 TaxID=2975909 RepID=UPI00225B7C8B|nr:bifunctional serine/threonine-protein kinase/glutamate ABC transporter substrate-binding protein [Streptomyces sp. NBC_01669]MCX4530862.1 bifunctional serine/threonine-protein kinase/glutamate ABC transporter substrate-binding protein [Streptomyces sp. NBC_01669]
MGLVWRARDLALHREVALKEVRPPDPSLAEYDPEAAAALRARVLREARALARIVHPNVVTIHHIVDGGEHTYPWLVMELVPGGSLHDRLDGGTLTPAEAAALGRGVLAGLRAAHAADIQHRDIKPPNILLRPDGRPVLTDFGIATVPGATVLTAAGSVIGTPDYMAPERVAGQDGGPAADLWSLAMTLYVAVEGHHPLRRANTLATLAAVLSEDVPLPRKAGPLAEALTSVLVRDAAARPDAEALDRMLAEAEAEAAAAPRTPARPAAGAPATPEARTPSAREDEPPSAPGPESTPAPHTAVAPATDPTSYRIAPPHPADPQPAQPPVPPTTPPAARRRNGRAYAYAVGALAGAGVLLWALLPDGNGSGNDNAGGGFSPGTGTGTPGSTAPAATGGGTGGNGPADGKKITIGIKPDQPGLDFRATDGTYAGFDIDVAKYVAASLGYDSAHIVWKEVASSLRETQLEHGDVDFIVASYTITDERDKRIDFAGPYLAAHQDVLVRADDTSIQVPGNLNDKKVCAVTGSVSALNIQTKYAPQAELLPRETYALCLGDLANGSVDAVTTDDTILAGYAAREPGRFKLGGFQMSDERYGIGIPHNSPLKQRIDTALQKMISDGTWTKSLRKHLPDLRATPPTP